MIKLQIIKIKSTVALNISMGVLVNGNWVSTLGLTKEQFSVIVNIASTQNIHRSEIYYDDYDQCLKNKALLIINNQLCAANNSDLTNKICNQLTIKEWFFSNAHNSATHVFYNDFANIVRVAELLREKHDSFHCKVASRSVFGHKGVDLIKSHWKIVDPVSPEFIENRAVNHLIAKGVKSSIALHNVQLLQQEGLLKNIN
jgi:hypothetical protein